MCNCEHKVEEVDVDPTFKRILEYSQCIGIEQKVPVIGFHKYIYY